MAVDPLKEQQSNEILMGVVPKRIMLFIHSMRGGGSERQLSYLANELAGRSETTLVTLDQAGNDNYPLDPTVERIGLGLTATNGGLVRGVLANLNRIRALRQHISTWKPQIVISFCDSNNILALAACPRKIPVIISERSDPRHQRLSRFWEGMRRYTYPKCHACVVQTSQVGEYLQSRRLVHRNQWVVIPSAMKSPAIDLVACERQRAAAEPKTLVYVGRLSKEKWVDRLLYAWAGLQKHHDQWSLNIVGDGAERSTLQDLARNLGVTNSVVWSLWSDDVWNSLRRANAYCLVSQYEGFPQSMLEAMAAGLPVAVTDCSPAIRQTITDGVDGLIISSEGQTAAVLDRLLSNPELRLSLGRNAASRARDFEWSSIAPLWLHAIHQAMD